MPFSPLSQHLLLQTMMQSVEALILVVDQDGHIEQFNRSCENITQYSFAEVEGKFVWDLFLSPQDADTTQQVYAELKETRRSNEHICHWFSRDGHPRQIHWRNTIITDPSGEILHLVSVGTDITARVKAEQQLQQHQYQLEELVQQRTASMEMLQKNQLRQERLATLGQLTATVSHELRNPLGTIRLSTYLLRQHIQTPHPQAEKSLQRIEQSILRCDQIVDELNNFTRPQQINRQEIPFDAWLQKLIEEQLSSQDVALVLSLQLGERRLSIDPELMRRAFINIFDNACQALQGDHAQAPTQHPRLHIESRLKAQRVEIIVSDNGPGIPESHLAHIFEPLFSTKSFGLGLGMSIVRQIMKRHSGNIEVRSSVGEGTYVTLWLPRSALVEEKT